MRALNPVRALAFVGRHATKFMAGGVLVGFFVPPLAALARPLLVPALVIPLTLALIRLDWTAIAACRRRAGLVAMLVVWILGVSPVLVWAITTPALALGLPPGLREALILMAASSPIVSSVAIALFVGLDASLAVVAVVLATALVPFTLPPWRWRCSASSSRSVCRPSWVASPRSWARRLSARGWFGASRDPPRSRRAGI